MTDRGRLVIDDLVGFFIAVVAIATLGGGVLLTQINQDNPAGGILLAAEQLVIPLSILVLLTIIFVLAGSGT